LLNIVKHEKLLQAAAKIAICVETNLQAKIGVWVS